MGYLNSGIGAARINDSSPSDYTTYSGNKIETKQDSTDNTLTTTSKTIVGAINEVNSKVNNKFIVAQTLPVSDIDEFAIYLVPKSTAQTNNIYDEYIYISTDTPTHWEKIGDTEIDLSGYYTSGQVDNLLDDKQDATDNNLDTTDKTIVGAINENKSVIGYSYDEYDATTAYSTGDLCIYNNTLYKAKQATTGNLPTNTTYWELTSIADAKQDATDNSLSTTDKTIVGAINELVTYKASKSDVDNNQISITKINQSAFNLIATRRGHCVILAFDGSLPSGTYGNIWQCSLKPTTSIRAVVAWGTSITLIDIDTDGIIGFRNAKTITESTYIGGELVFVTPS